DGFGRLQPPPPAAVAIPPGGFSSAAASPKHPPGLYGTETSRRALNLSPSMPVPRLLRDLPSGRARAVYTGARELDFRPGLLSLVLRGIWTGRTRRAASLLFAATVLAGLPGTEAAAQAPPSAAPEPAAVDDAAAVLATLTTRFAYVRTGNAEIDETARAGMSG